MSHYTDEDVERAVKATRRVKGGTIVGLLVENEVRMALDAVAPAIAARGEVNGLRKAAYALHDPKCAGCVEGSKYAGMATWLRDRADEIERSP